METGTLIGIFVGSFLGMLLMAAVFSWFFVPKQKHRMMQLQCNLLILMAEQSGIPTEHIDTLLQYTFQETNPWFIRRIKKQDRDDAAFIKERENRPISNP